MKLKSIIVLQAVAGAADIPDFDGVSISPEWDGFDVEEILQLEHGQDITKENWREQRDLIEPIQKRIFNAWKETHAKHHEFADWDDEPDANYYAIHFYPNFPGITEYLEHFSNYLINDCWTGRGADDDYFDYLPSITDVLFQLCKFYEHEMLWEQFMLRLLKLEWSGEPDDSESDPREQCLYRYKM